MKSRPIIFSGPMVRAIIDGAKTQTRRIVRMDGIYFVGGSGDDRNDPSNWGYEHPDAPSTWCVLKSDAPDDHQIPCPYGVPGDELWVREAIILRKLYEDIATDGPIVGAYEATRTPVVAAPTHPSYCGRACFDRPLKKDEFGCSGGRIPAMFTPRWASRLTLTVESVRVERVQDITETDAEAEGSPTWSGIPQFGPDCYRRWFRDAWDSINGKRAPWASNPWVWVVTFARKES